MKSNNGDANILEMFSLVPLRVAGGDVVINFGGEFSPGGPFRSGLGMWKMSAGVGTGCACNSGRFGVSGYLLISTS